ncbi:MAG TPA: 2-oxoglutarate and iron-dependent oxygenase domain-containing protein, partial [Flavobacterium sp.]|nr:2-oxoglutarate and iron-dependent oxygenase domain-containing protein [Flavobacterium sp.]
MQNIPSVDLRDFLSGDPERKQKFVNEIGKAYEDIGFVALKGHFLDDKLVDRLYGQVRNFFDLPVQTKLKYEIPGIGGQRGYVSFGKEHAKGRSAGDLKEFWHFGQYVENDPALEAEYPANV